MKCGNVEIISEQTEKSKVDFEEGREQRRL